MSPTPRVLAVDDDSSMRAALRRVVMAADIPVATFASVAELPNASRGG